MTDPRLVDIWPPLGLRIVAGDLELRGIGEAEVLDLLDVARAGIHTEGPSPFAVPWNLVPADELPLNYVQWWTNQVASFRREAWTLDLAVLWRGEVVGCQGVATRDFLTLRTGETGSWLGLSHHGQGIGTAMRQAFCAFLVDHLGFAQVTSTAYIDNHASRRVSEKTGYRPNGEFRHVRAGEAVAMQQFRLVPEDLVRGPDLSVTGADAVRRLIGLTG